MKQPVLFCTLLCSLLISGALHAQNKVTASNLPYFANRNWHYGFMLGVNGMNFSMQSDLTQSDSLISMEAKNGGGFNINIVADYHLTKNLDVRFVPGLSFGERTIEYVFETEPRNELITKRIESTYLEFPFLLKYSSLRDDNFAAFLLAGGKYSIDLSSQFDVDNNVLPINQVVALDRNNYWIETGGGVDFYLEYFKFSIELRLSYGLNDIMIRDNSIWTNPVNRALPKIVMIGFCFEG